MDNTTDQQRALPAADLFGGPATENIRHGWLPGSPQIEGLVYEEGMLYMCWLADPPLPFMAVVASGELLAFDAVGKVRHDFPDGVKWHVLVSPPNNALSNSHEI